MFEFIVVENPQITRRVDISAGGKAKKKLELKWHGLSMDDAADILDHYQNISAFWVDQDGGALTLDQAARDFIFLKDTDGNDLPVPRLYDDVVERKLKERLRSQQDFLRSIVMGPLSDLGIELSEDSLLEDLEGGLLQEWNLTVKGEVQDFTDPDVYKMVFGSNEFFFPVLTDFMELLNEVSGGKDKEKNLKSSAKSSPRRQNGRMRA
ncbi:MAG: hypothetical protein R3F02_18735 [Thiolinea sp.]